MTWKQRHKIYGVKSGEDGLFFWDSWMFIRKRMWGWNYCRLVHRVPWLPVSMLSAEAGVMAELDIVTSNKGLDGSGLTGKAVKWISTQYSTRFLGWRGSSWSKEHCSLSPRELCLISAGGVAAGGGIRNTDPFLQRRTSYSVMETTKVLNCWACFVTKCHHQSVRALKMENFHSVKLLKKGRQSTGLA